MAKVLELANVKLGSVVSDIMGKTGRAILDAMIDGEEDPHALAGLAHRTLRGKPDKLAEAVPGLIWDHHRFLLQRHLRLTDELSRQIEDLDGRIGAVTRPFDAALLLLESVPGVRRRSTEAMLAEIGDDMVEVPHAGRLRLLGSRVSRELRYARSTASKTRARSPFIENAGHGAILAAEEFFLAGLQNTHARRAYSRHRSMGFPEWCDERGMRLAAVRPGDANALVGDLERRRDTAHGAGRLGVVSCRTSSIVTRFC